MTKKLLGTLLILSAFVMGILPIAAKDTHGITIADIIATAAHSDVPEFTEFSRALNMADSQVMDQLANPNTKLTVFLPTDAAFQKIRETRYGAATLNLMFDNKSIMTNLVRYHIMEGEFPATALETLAKRAPGEGSASLLTTQGQYLRVAVNEDEDLLVDGEASTVLDGVAVTIVGGGGALTVAGRQINTINGVIHVIDTVLIPTTDTILQVLTDAYVDYDGQFNTLLQALNAADPALLQRLADPNSETTLFAPTDEAFEVFGEAALAAALQDEEAATRVLRYHMLDGRISSVEMMDAIASANDDRGVFVTQLGGLLSRTALEIRQSETELAGLVVNGGANIVVRDVDAGNGMIHVIDAVLQPPQ